MNGIDWVALPIVAELLGIQDIDALVTQLVAIREWQKPEPEEA